MAAQLFKIDAVVADGIALGIEDGSATLEGAAGWEHTPVMAAQGDDATSRKRIPRTLKCKLLFTSAYDPEQLANMSSIQITVRDSQAGRRGVAPVCTFAKLGALGAGGSVDIEFNLLSPIQWL